MKTTFENRNTKTPSVPKEKAAPAVAKDVSQVIGIEPMAGRRNEFNPFQISWVVHPSRRDKRTGALTPGAMSEYRAQQLRDMLQQFGACETCNGERTLLVPTTDEEDREIVLAEFCPTCKGVGV